MTFVIGRENSGKTVRDFLKIAGVSAALSAKLKRRAEGIMLNGTRVTVRAVLCEGDILSLDVADSEANEKILPFAREVEVLYEEAGFLAVNKPPDMPTHPSHGHFDDTLANALVWRYQKENPTFRPRFVNRLDRNTSGVVLVAKNAFFAARLSALMASGEIEKTYIAVLCGEISRETVLETGIKRQKESIILREVTKKGEGDLAITHVKPLTVRNGLTLVQLIPKTGRTHQLRVHAAHLGAPILGDDLYGSADPRIGRHALHAATLSFPHKETGERLSLFASMPSDMAAVIAENFGEEVLSLVR